MSKGSTKSKTLSKKELLNQKLLKILEISKEINAERDLAVFFNLLARQAAELMEADIASIFLLDKESFELWSIVTLDGTEIRFDARLGIAGASVASGEIINIVDAYQDPRFYRKIDGRNRYKTNTMLVVPLKNKDQEIVGTFQVLNKKNGVFSKDDEEILQSLAQHVEVALETNQLIENLTNRQRLLIKENNQLKKEIARDSFTQNIIGITPQVQNLVRLIEQISDTSVNVLITGETGTGKELTAKAIHFCSSRVSQPFVALNCAALPESLVESELFGIDKGVATGVDSRMGKFEEANGGTIFLDEIGDLSLTSQAKILRVLQEGEVERLGRRKKTKIDVRVLSATNKNLEKEIKKGNFREDLYYRLKVLHIQLPALREIVGDIELLGNYFISKFCKEMKKEEKKLARDTISYLKEYPWPGNIRELENEMKRLVALVPRKNIVPADLSSNILTEESSTYKSEVTSKVTIKEAVEALEKKMISDAMHQCKNNKGKVAKTLGLSRWGLSKKLKRYEIEKIQ